MSGIVFEIYLHGFPTGHETQHLPSDRCTVLRCPGNMLLRLLQRHEHGVHIPRAKAVTDIHAVRHLVGQQLVPVVD